MTTTYTAIPNGDIDQDSPVTQPLLTALRDNPLAQAEGATDAPYVQAAWHPYDGITIGDGNDGLIYDFAVAGAVGSLETPAWADGYEYRLMYVQLRHSGSSQSLQLELYKSSDAAYLTTFTIGAPISSASTINGHSEILRPRILLAPVNIISVVNAGGADTFNTFDMLVRTLSGANKYGKARLSFSSGASTAAGKIYMQKRLCYA